MVGKRFYKRLCDMVNDADAINNPMWARLKNKSFYDVLSHWITLPESIAVTNEEEAFFQEYLYPKSFNDNIGIIYKNGYWWDTIEEPTDEEWEQVMPELCGKLYFWYQHTCEKYVPLISMYTTNIENLLGQIKTFSVNRFNDTPQNTTTSDIDVEDMNHVSTVNRTESSTDGDTLINRLEEVRSKLRSIFAEWASDFDRFGLSE